MNKLTCAFTSVALAAGLAATTNAQGVPLSGAAVERYVWNQAKNQFDKAGVDLDDPSYFSRGLEVAWDLSKDTLSQSLQQELFKGDLLAKGVTLSLQSGKTVYMPNNLNAVATYTTNGVHLTMTTDPAEFPLKSTTPSVAGVGLGSYADPQFTLRFAMVLECDLNVPADPRTPVTISNMRVTAKDVNYSGDNLTGVAAQAVVSLLEDILGSKVTNIVNSQLNNENNKSNPWKSVLDKVNAPIAKAQKQGYSYLLDSLGSGLDASIVPTPSGNLLLFKVYKTAVRTTGNGLIHGTIVIDPKCGVPYTKPFQLKVQGKPGKPLPGGRPGPVRVQTIDVPGFQASPQLTFNMDAEINVPSLRPNSFGSMARVGKVTFGGWQGSPVGIECDYTVSGLPENTPVYVFLQPNFPALDWHGITPGQVPSFSPMMWQTPVTINGDKISFGKIKGMSNQFCLWHGLPVNNQSVIH